MCVDLLVWNASARAVEAEPAEPEEEKRNSTRVGTVSL